MSLTSDGTRHHRCRRTSSLILNPLREENQRKNNEIEELRKKLESQNALIESMRKQLAQYYACEIFIDKRWIVIEYVLGLPMRDYIRTHKWTQKLEQQYRSANHFIAQYGLRSQRENDGGNVLITMGDGKPTVKLIDFGTTAYA